MLKVSTYAKLYHIAATGFCIYTIYNLNDYINYNGQDIEDDTLLILIKYFPRFLTFWMFMLQTLYFGTCMMSYFLGLFTSARSLKQKIDTLSDDIVTSIGTPIAFMVTVGFWTVYLIDRELIYPKVIDTLMPPWMNHSLHTMNSVIALGDLFLVNHKYPPWRTTMTILVLYWTAYLLCLFGTFWETGTWLYPIMDSFSWPLRIIFIIITSVCALAMVGVTKYLSCLIWGSASINQMGDCGNSGWRSRGRLHRFSLSRGDPVTISFGRGISGPGKVKKGMSKPKHKKK